MKKLKMSFLSLVLALQLAFPAWVVARVFEATEEIKLLPLAGQGIHISGDVNRFKVEGGVLKYSNDSGVTYSPFFELPGATNGQILIGNGTSLQVGDLAGTANQVNVGSGSGSLTLSLPQDIHSGASPTFANATVTTKVDTGSLRVGSGALDASSVLDSVSTTKGARPCPSMTEAQRDAIGSPAIGLCVFNTDTKKLNSYTGAVWETSGGGGISAWVTATTYSIGDIVHESDRVYRAISAHTSGVFATDLPTNWTQMNTSYPGGVSSAGNIVLNGASIPVRNLLGSTDASQIGISGGISLGSVNGNIQIHSSGSTNGDVVVNAGSGAGKIEFRTAAAVKATLKNSGALNLDSLTANRALVSDGSKDLVSSSATDTEVGYLSGVTSAIQTQINSKLNNTISEANAVVFTGSGSGVTTSAANFGFNSATNTLNVAGPITQNGLTIDQDNLLQDGGFEGGTGNIGSGTGTLSSETSIVSHGGKSLKVALSSQQATRTQCTQAAKATEWVGRMVDVSCRVKSSLTNVTLSSFDGTNNVQTIQYDGSNVWRKMTARMQINSGNSACWRVETLASTTGDIYLDQCEIGEMKVDGTTKVFAQYNKSYTLAGHGATNTKIPYFTTSTTQGDAAGTIDNSSTLGWSFTATKPRTVVNISYSSYFGTEHIGFSLNSNELTTNIDGINLAHRLPHVRIDTNTWPKSVAATAVLNVGDVIRVHTQGAATAATSAILAFTATAYEQAFTIDATGGVQDSFTDPVQYTPVFSGVTPTVLNVRWSREGKFLNITGGFTWGTGTASTFEMYLPVINGVQLTAHLPDTALTEHTVGKLSINTAATNNDFILFVDDTIPNRLRFGRTQDGGAAPLSARAGTDIANATKVRFYSVRIPITQWSANPRIIGTFRPAVNSSIRTGGDAISMAHATLYYLDYPTLNKDLDNNMVGCGTGSKVVTNTGCKYVVKESGPHSIIGSYYLDTAEVDLGEAVQIYLRVNNVTQCISGINGEASTASVLALFPYINCTLDLAKNDIVEIVAFHNANIAITRQSGTSTNIFSVTKLDQAGTLNAKADLSTEYSLTVTASSCAGWATIGNAIGVPSQVSNGVWFIDLIFAGSHNSLATCDVAITGISSQSGTAQACTITGGSTNSYGQSIIDPTTNVLKARYGVAQSASYFNCRIRLASKPTFVP